MFIPNPFPNINNQRLKRIRSVLSSLNDVSCKQVVVRNFIEKYFFEPDRKRLMADGTIYFHRPLLLAESPTAVGNSRKNHQSRADFIGATYTRCDFAHTILVRAN